MTLREFSTVIDVPLEIKLYPWGWGCRFEHSETKKNKHSAGLLGEMGHGETPQAALEDYAKNIRGKWLVINASSKDRKEFGVPETLEP